MPATGRIEPRRLRRSRRTVVRCCVALAAVVFCILHLKPAHAASISDFYPRRGSYEGGTHVTIEGYGFASGAGGLEDDVLV